MHNAFQIWLFLGLNLLAGAVIAAPGADHSILLQSIEPSGYAVIVVCGLVFLIGLLMRVRKF